MLAQPRVSDLIFGRRRYTQLLEWWKTLRPDGGATVILDPVAANPDLYKVIFENDRVRVLEYLDRPGEKATPHSHPDSVMYTLSPFERRLHGDGDMTRDVQMPSGFVGWLPAQQHSGHNIGRTDTHVIFFELKEPSPASPPSSTEPGPAVQ